MRSARQRTIADVLSNASTSLETLGSTLQEHHGFSESEAAEATETLERAEVMLGHAPLMEHMRDTAVHDLSGDPAVWHRAIDELGDEGVPPNIQGDDEEVRKDRYARVIARSVERKFPTRVFAQRLATDPEIDLPYKEQVAAFLVRQQNFNLATTPIKPYLAERDLDLGDVDDVDAFAESIMALQRVHRPGAGFDVAKSLFTQGLQSARTISQESSQVAKVEQMALGDDADRTGLFQLFSARHDFPSEWHRFLHPGEVTDELVLTLGLSPERFPAFSRHRTIEIKDVHLLLSLHPDVEYDEDRDPLRFTLRSPSGAVYPPDSDDGGSFSSSVSLVEGMPYAQPVEGLEESAGTWAIVVSRDGIPDALSGEGADPLDDEAVRDILVICNYQLV